MKLPKRTGRIVLAVLLVALLIPVPPKDAEARGLWGAAIWAGSFVFATAYSQPNCMGTPIRRYFAPMQSIDSWEQKFFQSRFTKSYRRYGDCHNIHESQRPPPAGRG